MLEQRPLNRRQTIARLAGLLARENRRVEAAALVHETLAMPADAVKDPWLAYGAADQRFWPVHATELRRQVRR